MKNILFLFIFLAPFILIKCSSDNSHSGNTNDTIPTKENYLTENLPDAFNKYPVGIEVQNDPDTIYAELNDRGTKKYIWKNTTTIKALNTDLQIIEFGSYNFIDGNWKLGDYTKKPFTTEEFDKWYCRKKNGIITFDYCIEGKISKGVEYIDPSNFSIRKDTLVSRNGLWYYIGIDASGKKYMGYGRYYTVAQMKK